jgi:hypothetical protein
MSHFDLEELGGDVKSYEMNVIWNRVFILACNLLKSVPYFKHNM